MSSCRVLMCREANLVCECWPRKKRAETVGACHREAAPGARCRQEAAARCVPASSPAEGAPVTVWVGASAGAGTGTLGISPSTRSVRLWVGARIPRGPLPSLWQAIAAAASNALDRLDRSRFHDKIEIGRAHV